jgi:Mrp family chromosome partitioning ATPase/capsular polysaccharide biosynthesis protein
MAANQINTEEINELNDKYPYSNYKKPQQDLNSFFSRFFRIVLIHKWIFLSVFVAILLLVLLYALKQPKVYQSNYEVFYNETMREYMSLDDAPVVKSDFDKNYWLSAMKSDEVLKSTIKNSGLTYSVSHLKSMLFVGIIDKRKEDRIPVYLVSISCKFNEHIPILIRAYVKSLNELLLSNQVSNSERLVVYLGDQINQNNQKLNQIDISIRQTGASKGTEIIDFAKISTMLDQFRADLLNARVNLASIMAARIRTENELKNLDGTIINESAFSEPLKVQLMNLEVDLARSLTRNKEDHPEVKQIRQNIEQISTMIRDTLQQRMEVRSLIQNPLKGQLMSKLMEYKIQEVSEDTKVKSLERIIAELEAKTLPGSINEEQQQTLRNREMVSMTIKQLNDKLIETQSTSQGSLSRFVFVDDPSSVFIANKGIMFYIIFAFLLGLVIASLIVFVYDMLDDRIMLIDDYDRFYASPMLGVVKHYSDNENALVTVNPITGAKYRSTSDMSNLIINLRQIQKLKELKTFVISSPDRLDGKSLVSMKMAAAIANKMQRVLLVDMDFFSPKLSSKVEPEFEIGLSNYLMSECDLQTIIKPTEIDTLHFVNAGNADGHKELFYNNKKLVEFIEWARANYEIVIFDTPAAIYIPDIVDFFDYIDGIFVIVRLRRTTRTMLNKLFKVLTAFNTKYIAAVINDFYEGQGGAYDDYNYSSHDYYKDADNNKGLLAKIKRPRKSILFVIVFSVIGFISIVSYLYRNSIFPFNNKKSSKIELKSDEVSTIDANNATKFESEYSVQTNLDSVIVSTEKRFDEIALTHFGNEKFWVYIYLVNRNKGISPYNLKQGDVVYLPSVDNYDMNAADPQSVDKAAKIEKEIIAGNL